MLLLLLFEDENLRHGKVMDPKFLEGKLGFKLW